MKNTPFIIFLFSCILFTGCAKLRHMEQLLTLKAMGEEGEAIDAYVDERNAQFAAMLEHVHNGTLENSYPTKASFVEAFGEPLFIEHVKNENGTLEHWVYRKVVERTNTDFVHLYFDADGRLAKWEHVPAEIILDDTNRLPEGDVLLYDGF